MRKLMIIVLVLIVALVSVIPVLAAGPCDDGGLPGNSDYAQGHIKPLATSGALGNDGHKPGAHQGFSVCNPSGK